MPYCGSRNCQHCFPPGAEERAVLDEAIEQIEYKVADASTTPPWTAYDGTRFDRGIALESHPDAYEPWFQALAAAYAAGMAAALKEVQDIRKRFDK